LACALQLRGFAPPERLHTLAYISFPALPAMFTSLTRFNARAPLEKQALPGIVAPNAVRIKSRRPTPLTLGAATVAAAGISQKQTFIDDIAKTALPG